MAEEFRYVPHGKVAEWQAKGWTVSNALHGTHHGDHAVLMVAPPLVEPSGPLIVYLVSPEPGITELVIGEGEHTCKRYRLSEGMLRNLAEDAIKMGWRPSAHDL